MNEERHELSLTDDSSTEQKTDDSAINSSNKFEMLITNVGALVTGTAKVTAFKSIQLTVKVLQKTALLLAPLKHNIHYALKRVLRGFGKKFVAFTESVVETEKKFSKRKSQLGFKKAVSLLLVDFAGDLRQNKNTLRTLINHAAPVLAVALLVSVVNKTASVDYGISVGYNGQTLGVVTTESIIDEAQKTISGRATYYDTGSQNPVAATFSITPLTSVDEVIDENELVNMIAEAEQLPELDFIENNSDIPVFETFSLGSESFDDVESDKIRAYPVTVNGESIGAVTEFNKIEEYLNSMKAQYLTEDVVSVGFDKEIEYGYEQYVSPDDICSQQDIIDIFTSIVSEPVYYEVQEGDNPWQISRDNNMTEDELKQCFITHRGEIIEDITENCPIGAIIQLSAEVPYLQPLITKEVTYKKTIDFDTVYTDDDDMYKGETEIDVKGVEGKKRIYALVTYKNGKAVSREILSEEIVSEPVTQYARVGTRKTITPVSEGSGGSGDYFWPVGGGYISAYQGDGRGHKGIDIAAPYGTPIYAASNGTIDTLVSSGWGSGYGNHIVMDNDDGNVCMYAHMSYIADGLSEGDYVVKGQLIGYVGSTGDSSGNHLHFEVRSGNGKYYNPCDYVTQ